MQRAFDWFWGLSLAQKVLAVLFAGLFLFSASYLVTTAFLTLRGYGDQTNSPSGQGAAPQGTGPGSASAELPPVPDFAVKIASARWEGEKAVVEGTWKGDVSSVHCDLLEGGESGRPTDWWDRSFGTEMDWSGRAFSQEFVEDEGREAEEPVDPVDPTDSYWVWCSGQFSDGWSTNDSAPVEDTPPG